MLTRARTIRRQRLRSDAPSMDMLKQNAILSHLQGSDAAEVVELGELVEMQVKYEVYEADEAIREVFFPLEAVLSVVTQMKNGDMIEVGTIGREGTSGIPFLMGASTTANDCFCQVPGRAIKIQSEHFHRLVGTNQTFRELLNRYLQAYVNFLGQLAGCNRLHSVYERCARWLLLSHDRVNHDEIHLTHEYLAMMLGSRRSGVTIALATLQRAGYIEYAHGCIRILERAGLEETTCECYGIARAQFSALMPPLH